MNKQELAAIIDHTLLKAEATTADITKLCRQAAEFGFASVCVQPRYVPLATQLCAGTKVKVCTVIGFPMGANEERVKIFEAMQAVAQGAQELDMVINLGALKEGKDKQVVSEITGVVKAGVPVKVIIETCLLTREEKIRACRLCELAGAHFVKTSTGYAGGGATVEDIRLMRETLSRKVKVKASGGIRTLEQAQALVEAGAERLGTGSACTIMQGFDA